MKTKRNRKTRKNNRIHKYTRKNNRIHKYTGKNKRGGMEGRRIQRPRIGKYSKYRSFIIPPIPLKDTIRTLGLKGVPTLILPNTINGNLVNKISSLGFLAEKVNSKIHKYFPGMEITDLLNLWDDAIQAWVLTILINGDNYFLEFPGKPPTQVRKDGNNIYLLKGSDLMVIEMGEGRVDKLIINGKMEIPLETITETRQSNTTISSPPVSVTSSPTPSVQEDPSTPSVQQIAAPIISTSDALDLQHEYHQKSFWDETGEAWSGAVVDGGKRSKRSKRKYKKRSKRSKRKSKKR